MENTYLSHYGILGQRWGVRRFQNSDGSLNTAGKKKQARVDKRAQKKELHKENQSFKKSALKGPTGDMGTNRNVMRRRVKRAQKYMSKNSSLTVKEALAKSTAHDKAVTKAWVGTLGTLLAGSILINALGV